MATIDMEKLITDARRAILAPNSRGGWTGEGAAERVVPLIVAAVANEVRKMHAPIDAMMYGQNAVTAVKVCSECGTDDGSWKRHPCPTMRLLDAIEAEVS